MGTLCKKPLKKNEVRQIYLEKSNEFKCEISCLVLSRPGTGFFV